MQDASIAIPPQLAVFEADQAHLFPLQLGIEYTSCSNTCWPGWFLIHVWSKVQKHWSTQLLEKKRTETGSEPWRSQDLDVPLWRLNGPCTHAPISLKSLSISRCTTVHACKPCGEEAAKSGVRGLSEFVQLGCRAFGPDLTKTFSVFQNQHGGLQLALKNSERRLATALGRFQLCAHDECSVGKSLGFECSEATPRPQGSDGKAVCGALSQIRSGVPGSRAPVYWCSLAPWCRCGPKGWGNRPFENRASPSSVMPCQAGLILLGKMRLPTASSTQLLPVARIPCPILN